MAQTNYVMNFSGTGDSDNLGNSVGNGFRTVECWFKPSVTYNSSSSQPGAPLVLRDDLTQTHEFALLIVGTDFSSNYGQLIFGVRHNGTDHRVYSNSSTWVAGTWYHVAGVIDPTQGVLMYVNGVLQTQTDPTSTTPSDTDNSNPTILGEWPNSTRFFDGEIDELRFWNRALSQSEIQAKMCQDLVPANETGLQGYYKFNEGNGTQVLDQTANAYNGTVNGATWVHDNYCSTGINAKETLPEGIRLSLCPNPANTNFTIEVSDLQEQASFQVLNSMGQELMNGKLLPGKNNVAVSDLQNGVYYVSVKMNNGHASQKLIIQK